MVMNQFPRVHVELNRKLFLEKPRGLDLIDFRKLFCLFYNLKKIKFLNNSSHNPQVQ